MSLIYETNENTLLIPEGKFNFFRQSFDEASRLPGHPGAKCTAQRQEARPRSQVLQEKQPNAQHFTGWPGTARKYTN